MSRARPEIKALIGFLLKRPAAVFGHGPLRAAIIALSFVIFITLLRGRADNPQSGFFAVFSACRGCAAGMTRGPVFEGYPACPAGCDMPCRCAGMAPVDGTDAPAPQRHEQGGGPAGDGRAPAPLVIPNERAATRRTGCDWITAGPDCNRPTGAADPPCRRHSAAGDTHFFSLSTAGCISSLLPTPPCSRTEYGGPPDAGPSTIKTFLKSLVGKWAGGSRHGLDRPPNF